MKFEVGDHVRWNSDAGHVSGRIIKIHSHHTVYKGHPPPCQQRGTPVRDPER